MYRSKESGLKMLDLCSGIAGISMAADWAGIDTAAFCEIEEFNQKVLRKNYPNIPIFPDLYKLMKQSLIDGGVDVDSIGVISAGYPCQGESLVGKRRGAEDERWLWPEVFRLIKELRPTWFVGENVAGHVTMGLDTVLSDLEKKTTRQGRLYFRLSVSARRIKDTGHLLLATPTTSQNYKPIRELCPSEANGKHGKTLPGSIGEHFPEHIGKKINPQFVEWMMGLPQDWTKID